MATKGKCEGDCRLGGYGAVYKVTHPPLFPPPNGDKGATAHSTKLRIPHFYSPCGPRDAILEFWESYSWADAIGCGALRRSTKRLVQVEGIDDPCRAQQAFRGPQSGSAVLGQLGIERRLNLENRKKLGTAGNRKGPGHLCDLSPNGRKMLAHGAAAQRGDGETLRRRLRSEPAAVRSAEKKREHRGLEALFWASWNAPVGGVSCQGGEAGRCHARGEAAISHRSLRKQHSRRQ